MNINYLREFVTLAQSNNFMEAAEHLYISQSTLSKHIKNMETELNVTLFTRSTRKVELSEYGKLLYPYAHKIIHLENEYTAALIDNMEESRRRLAIGSIPALAQYGITDIMVRFRRENPHMQLSITQEGSDELAQMLREGKCELAFIRELDRSSQEFARIPYAKDALSCVLPKSHPLASETLLNLKELKDEEFILVAENTMIYTLSVQACENCGFIPTVTYTDHKIENIFDLVKKGMGISLLMDHVAQHIHNPELVVVQLTPPIQTEINICYRKDRELSIAAKHFLQCLDSY